MSDSICDFFSSIEHHVAIALGISDDNLHKHKENIEKVALEAYDKYSEANEAVSSANRENPPRTFSKSDRAKVAVISILLAFISIYVLEPQIEPISEEHSQFRAVTLDIGNGMRTLSEPIKKCDYLTDEQGNPLSTYTACYKANDVDTTKKGIVTQKVNIDLRDENGEVSGGFIQINIKTFTDKGFKFINPSKVIVDSVNEARGDIRVKKKYDLNLQNGKTVTVHQLYSPMKGYQDCKADLFSFMQDENTIVTVLCTPVTKTKQLVNTLKIFDL